VHESLPTPSCTDNLVIETEKHKWRALGPSIAISKTTAGASGLRTAKSLVNVAQMFG